MVEKRRVSTRHKAEPPAKKRTPTPTPVREPSHIEPPAVKGDALPYKIRSDQPLPTLEQPQRLDLPSQEYQSIPRSGVLAASLERSRQKWLTEGIFERYWTKPSRKKNQLEAPNNPSRDTMLKIGTCKLTIEPHVFEVTLFTIKEPNTVPAVEQSVQKPVQQYGTPNSVSMPPSSAPATSFQHPSVQTPSTRTTTHPPTSTYAKPASIPNPQGPQENPHTSQHPTPSSSTAEPHITNPPVPSRSNSVTPAPLKEPVKPTQDPVIQMLATRASSNAPLKALMKVVASGNASHDQLKVFQSHIDELTALLVRQNSTTAPPPTPASAPRPTPPAHAPYSLQHPAPSAPYRVPPAPAVTPQTTSKYPSKAPQSQPVSYAQSTPSMLSRPPPPPKRPDITGIALEFSGGSGDRFLFPTHSILEYLPGNRQVIASFLVVRRGSSAAAPSDYAPEQEYYQPVTVRFTTDFPKVLEPLARVVKPQDEVRRWMNEVMDRCTRAEYVYLAVRLPRPEGAGNAEEEADGEVRSREESTSTSFTPAGSVAPERWRVSKAVKVP